jgi:hypothetical protein
MPFTVQRYEEIDTELQRIQEYLAKLLTEMQVNELDPKMRDAALVASSYSRRRQRVAGAISHQAGEEAPATLIASDSSSVWLA